jgi:hypothetical protein
MQVYFVKRLVLILCILALTAMTTRAQGEGRPNYRELAKDYASAMVDRDYGQIDDIFPTMIDRETMSLHDNPREAWPIRREETGVRNIDRAFNAANPRHDQALHELLYLLTEDTGNAKWARAADASYSWFLEHTQHPKTGLLAMGDHLGWRLDTNEPVRHPNSEWADLKHEFHEDMPWPKLFELNPEAAARYAEGIWQHHVYDREKGLHAHQTRWDTGEPDKGYVFPRMPGHMTLAFAWAHKYADGQKERDKWVRRINFIADTHNARRHPETDAAHRLHPKRGNFYPPFNDLKGVLDAHRALQLELPEETREKIRDWTRRSDRTILKLDHDPVGRGWRKRVEPDNFELEENRPAVEKGLWCSRYARKTAMASIALRMYRRYRQNGDDRYLTPVLETAQRYVATRPVCEQYPIRPSSVSQAINLMLAAHRETGKDVYLRQADLFGRRAVEMFLDETSPLPKVFSRGFSHYEAKTGGPALMKTLYLLGKRLAK